MKCIVHSDLLGVVLLGLFWVFKNTHSGDLAKQRELEAPTWDTTQKSLDLPGPIK